MSFWLKSLKTQNNLILYEFELEISEIETAKVTKTKFSENSETFFYHLS
jgi:hypothetical protein